MGLISDYIKHGADRGDYRDPAQRHNGDGTRDVAVHSVMNPTVSSGRTAGRTPRSQDGQHYVTSWYSPGPQSGMKSKIADNAQVGMKSSRESAVSVGVVPMTSMTQCVDGAGPTPGIVTGNNKGVN